MRLDIDFYGDLANITFVPSLLARILWRTPSRTICVTRDRFGLWCDDKTGAALDFDLQVAIRDEERRQFACPRCGRGRSRSAGCPTACKPYLGGAATR